MPTIDETDSISNTTLVLVLTKEETIQGFGGLFITEAMYH